MENFDGNHREDDQQSSHGVARLVSLRESQSFESSDGINEDDVLSPLPISENDRAREQMMRPGGDEREHQEGDKKTKRRCILRTKSHLNVDTGSFVKRECHIEVVTGLVDPMDPAERREREFLAMSGRTGAGLSSLFRKYKWRSDKEGTPKRKSADKYDTKDRQYRFNIKMTGADPDMNFLDGQNLTRYINRYVQWTFQVSTTRVFLSLITKYLIFVTVWCLVIFAMAQLWPKCFYVSDLPFDEAGNHFIDAWAMSWTTFSTVGYGLTGPVPSSSNDHCLGTNIATSIEAFVGVLYAGFASAIIYGKITRVLASARVEWSSPMVVRYGKGVDTSCAIPSPKREPHEDNRTENRELENHDDCSSTDQDEYGECHLPCPVLEFRVVNLLSNQAGGELVDSNITVWASKLASSESPSTHTAASINWNDPNFKVGSDINSFEMGRRGGSNPNTQRSIKRVERSRTPSSLPGVVDFKSEQHEIQPMKDDSKPGPGFFRNHQKSLSVAEMREAVVKIVHTDRREFMQRAVSLVESNRQIAIQEDPTSKVAPHLIYSKLDVHTDKHPFFKRAWIIRHTLDADSPLLKPKAQSSIRENNGQWPSEWNNFRDIRRHICFNEIIVSLSGMANVSGRTVYSHKCYDYCDMNIGWRFADILVCHPGTNNLSVDVELINDVLEQHGGGGEPLISGSDDNDDHGFYRESFRRLRGNLIKGNEANSGEVGEVVLKKH